MPKGFDLRCAVGKTAAEWRIGLVKQTKTGRIALGPQY
jgi:hypothetical protein